MSIPSLYIVHGQILTLYSLWPSIFILTSYPHSLEVLWVSEYVTFLQSNFYGIWTGTLTGISARILTGKLTEQPASMLAEMRLEYWLANRPTYWAAYLRWYSSRPLMPSRQQFYTKTATFEKIIKDQRKQRGSSTSESITRIPIPLIS